MDKGNQAAIWTCVILQQALGFAWYSDLLFNGAWATALGPHPAGSHPMYIALFMSFAASMLSTRMLAWMFTQMKITDAFRGTLIALLAWLAFTGPVLAAHYLTMGLSDTVLFLDAGKELLAFGLTGAILSVWPSKKAV